jgi:Ni/Co efflux regulator RcnB
MKPLLMAVMAVSLVAGAATVTSASAQDERKVVTERPNGSRVVKRTTVRPNGNVVTTRKMKWNRGQSLPAAYRGRNNYVDWRAHHLRQPPGGYQWVQVDGQYVLVAVATGLIADAIFGQ